MAKTTGAKTPQARSERARARWMRRGWWTLVVLGLLSWLGWLVVSPFLHPRTHLVLLAGDVVSLDPAVSGAPADFVVEDFRELLSLRDVLDRGLVGDSGPLVLGTLRNPDEMNHLADRLTEVASGPHDVLLLYVSAHGIVQDGDAWLLATGADPHSPLGGRYRLSNLLAQLKECQAPAKVLILDAGRIEFDPTRGLLENDFSERLVEQVAGLGDPDLWVLVSHSAGERSHLSPALRRSVFGYFVATGLQGAADSSGDRSIDLGELSRFVTSGVSGWVRQTTDGAAQQTPRLAWGGGVASLHSGPVLSAVPKDKAAAPREVDHVKAVAQAREASDVEKQVAIQTRTELTSFISSSIGQATPSGRLGQIAADKARAAMNQALGQSPIAKALPKQEEKPEAGKPPSADPAAPDATKSAMEKKPEESSPESDKTKGDAKTKSKPDSSAANETAEAAAKQPPSVSFAEIDDLLARGWKLRDELDDPARTTSRPVECAPHFWRLLEARLLALDRKRRTGFIVDTNAYAAALGEIVTTLEQLAAGTPADRLPAGSLASQIAAMRPGQALAGAEIRSLAMAELVAQGGGPPVTNDLATLIGRLDQIVGGGNRADLERLAKDLKPEHDRYVELRAARRLAERPDLDWRLVHLVLTNARVGERAAAGSLDAPYWVRGKVEEADAIRVGAQREAFSPAGGDRDALLARLAKSRDLYLAASDDLAAVRAAQRQWQDVLHRLPSYLALRYVAGESKDAFFPSQTALLALIKDADQLGQKLSKPGPEQLALLRAASSQLERSHRAVAEPIASQAMLRLADSPAVAGASWRMAMLLETPLPAANLRAALAAALPEVDAELAAQIQPPDESETGSPEISQAAAERLFAPRAELEHAALASVLVPAGNSDWEPLDLAWQLLRSTSHSLSTQQSSFAVALADLYRNLPARVQRGLADSADLSSPATREERLAKLSAWRTAQRLIPAAAAVAWQDSATEPHLAPAHAYDWLVWQRSRALAAAEDAPPLDAGYLQGVASDLLSAAARIPRQPPLVTGPSSPIELAGTQLVPLSLDASAPLDLSLRYSGPAGAKAWVVLEYDPAIIAVEAIAPALVHSWAELASAAGSLETTALTSELTRLPRSLELSSGRTVPIRLLVKRLSAAPRPSHLVVRVFAESNVARHDAEITLPLPEAVGLVVTGTPGSWTPAGGGLTLHPFPNRTTEYALQLASGTGDERKVDVEIFALTATPSQSFPQATLTSDDSQRLRSLLELGPAVGEAKGLTLPADGRPAKVMLTAPMPIAPPPPKSADGAEPTAAPSPPAAEKPPPTPLDHGLLLLITDTKDKSQIFKHLTATPQRPQRYVRPRVSYSGARERVEIVVAAAQASLLPPGGVRVNADILEPLPTDSERQLDGTLTTDKEAELYVEVPAAPAKFVTLRLAVDGYPRAFIYRVPCSGDAVDIQEETDLVSVTVSDLPKGTIYKPPVATIPVQLQIDAPSSALGNPPLRAEVGIDRDRDRELAGDEVVVLTTDRQVAASLVGLGKQGQLIVEAKVSDPIIDVPAASLGSGRANAMARVALGDNVAYSPPVEIVIDSRPPKVSGIELKSGRLVVIGGNLELSALADDGQLSGIARVEALFDKARSGKFPPEAAPFPGAPQDDGRWLVKLPTGDLTSGTFNVLVRATDRAGNIGEIARTSVQVVSPDEATAAEAARNLADITGIVSYGPDPQAGIKVVLAADAGMPLAAPPTGKVAPPKDPPANILAQATTRADGTFVFPKIAPGNYVVFAEALIKNKNRRAQGSVSFKTPKEVEPVELKLQ